MPDGDEERRPEKKPGDEGDFDGKTYLYIKTHPLDDGSEPLPAGLEFWISPHITIVKPDGTRGQEATAGKENGVEVIVTNKGGLDAVNAYVECFVADPSTGFTPASCTKVLADYLSVPAHGTATLTGRWTPTESESGHRCLLARVCSTVPPDCFHDWGVFDVVGDRHEAQRNIFVIPVPEGEDSISFGFQVVNPHEGKMETIIRTAAVEPDRRGAIVRAVFGDAPVAISKKVQTGLHVELGGLLEHRISGDSGTTIRRTAGRAKKGGLVATAFPFGTLKRALPPLAERQTARRLAMTNREVRHAVVIIPRTAGVRTGELEVLSVEQVDAESGRVIGGLCLVLKH
jgi:hypothetical protein